MAEINVTKNPCLEISIDRTKSEMLHYFSSVYITTPMFVFGFITNIISIVLWKRLIKRARNRNISCGVYLVTIAAADTGTITSFFLTDTLRFMVPSITKYHGYNIFFVYIGYPAHMFFTFLSFWLIAGVDTCRLTMVIFPFKLRQAATRVTNTVILMIIVYVFLVNIPNFFAFTTTTTPQGTGCIIYTSLYKLKSFFNYTFWFQCVFLTVFPWSVIILVNIFMLCHKIIIPVYLPEWKRRGKEMGRVLFAVSVWFVAIIFWQCVAQCFFLQKKDEPKEDWEDINRSFAFAKLGLVINSSTKFILYMVASVTFRKSFIHFITNNKSSYMSSPNIELHKKVKDSNKKNKKTRSINAISPLGLPDPSHDEVTTGQSRRRLFAIQELSSIDITV